LAGETEVHGENLPQRHFVHHKSDLTRPGREPVKGIAVRTNGFNQDFFRLSLDLHINLRLRNLKQFMQMTLQYQDIDCFIKKFDFWY
jgi:hypothetical protein